MRTDCTWTRRKCCITWRNNLTRFQPSCTIRVFFVFSRSPHFLFPSRESITKSNSLSPPRELEATQTSLQISIGRSGKYIPRSGPPWRILQLPRVARSIPRLEQVLQWSPPALSCPTINQDAEKHRRSMAYRSSLRPTVSLWQSAVSLSWWQCLDCFGS
ncbi:unnamed protein product [Periconia digitata]|uniref:Uncharacterized protein n=1 Tax=Periconia digitata TaxID=1303443 RepID=A0A9W4UH04_9PLEO|nr:unnamed protein product [Periconia digitata]